MTDRICHESSSVAWHIGVKKSSHLVVSIYREIKVFKNYKCNSRIFLAKLCLLGNLGVTYTCLFDGILEGIRIDFVVQSM